MDYCSRSGWKQDDPFLVVSDVIGTAWRQSLSQVPGSVLALKAASPQILGDA